MTGGDLQTGAVDGGWRATASHARRKHAPGEIAYSVAGIVLEYDV